MPMYFLSKLVSTQTDYKVVISGEGADELFGGYLYFKLAPNNDAFQKESIRLIENLHKYDVLRSDRSTAAHGLEVRVPFLDREFVKYVVSICPEYKRDNVCDIYNSSQNIEKWILRAAFEGFLPDEILWRQKEAFSDGVGYDWVNSLKKHADEQITDEEFSNASSRFLDNVPLSKEEYLYRDIYEKIFPLSVCDINETWRPFWTDEKDPSATKLSVHCSNLS